MRLGMLLGVHDPRRNRDAPNKNVDQSIIVGTKGEQMPLSRALAAIGLVLSLAEAAAGGLRHAENLRRHAVIAGGDRAPTCEKLSRR